IRISLIAAEAASEGRDGACRDIQAALGYIFAHRGFKISFEQSQHSFVIKVREVNPQRSSAMTFVFRILAPVAGNDVHTSVAIQVTGSDSVPPTSELAKIIGGLP